MARKQTPKTGAQELTIEERRVRAVELRREGRHYRAIAAELGVTLSTAYKDVAVVLKRTRDKADESAEELRQIELERLDLIVEKLTPKLDSADPKTVTRAAQVLRTVSESRRKLLGLDAPARLEHSGPEGAPIPVDARADLLERIAGLVTGATADGEAAGDSSEPEAG